VFVFGLSFAVQNMESVHLRYYFGLEWGPVPVSLVVVVVFVLGVLVGGLAAGLAVLSRQREVRRLRRKQEELEQELGRLRKLPLRDEP
jgi:putative membrane protein